MPTPPESATLNCRGLRCPMPIVQLSRAMRNVPPGGSLAVEATDPAFHPDLAAWARQSGHTVVEYVKGDIQRAVVAKPMASAGPTSD